MEMKISKTVNVEMDESLGYTMVFIKFDELKKESFMETIKQETLGSLLPFVGREQILDAYNECHVLTHWLDKGYLCYPAYENHLAYRPYNCGPKYIKAIDSILEKVNLRVKNELLRMCEDLTSQITDWLNATAKNVAAAEAEKKAEQTVPQDAFSEKLKKAVEMLHRKDIIWANGNVYFQTNRRWVLDTYPMKSLWLSHRSLHSFPVVDIVTGPLMDGKILLTLPDAMEDAQAEYWSLLIDLVGRDNMKNAADAVDALCGVLRKLAEDIKPEEKPEQLTSTKSPAPQEGVEEAVKKLNRKDVIFKQGNAYFQMPGPIVGLVNTAPTANFLASVSGWNDSQIWHRFVMPMAEGKILLTLPAEMKCLESTYRSLLRTIVRESVVQEVRACQEALCRIMEEQSASKVEQTKEPLYFQIPLYTRQASFVEDMRLLWQNNVRGVNMSSIEETVLNPLHKGKISLLNDLPEVAVEFGLKYCRFLKYWLHPITWAMFADTWNKIHPDTKV